MKSCFVHSIRQNPDPASFCPPEIFGQLVEVPVRFVSFSMIEGGGVIEVHHKLAADVEDLFDLMLAECFPLSSALPIACFDWEDEASMQANNTSGFNYRKIANSERLSYHALGRAIDINPLFNPYIRGTFVQPEGAVYDPKRPGALTADSSVTKFLKDRGWTWGGDWTSLKDYQHFEKPE